MYRRTPTAKKSLAGFLGGGAVTLGIGFSAAVADAALLVAPAVVGLAFAAVGVAWYAISPRSLVAAEEAQRLEREAERLLHDALPPVALLPLPSDSIAGSVTITGEVMPGLAQRALFADRPVAIERVSGATPGGAVDDVRVVPFDLRVGPDLVVHVEPEGWVVDIACPDEVCEPLDDAQREFLEARGARPDRGAVLVRSGHVAAGDHLIVEGRTEERVVPGGYRGSDRVTWIVGPYAQVRRQLLEGGKMFHGDERETAHSGSSPKGSPEAA